jgi:hypothetical protein
VTVLPPLLLQAPLLLFHQLRQERSHLQVPMPAESLQPLSMLCSTPAAAAAVTLHQDEP